MLHRRGLTAMAMIIVMMKNHLSPAGGDFLHAVLEALEGGPVRCLAGPALLHEGCQGRRAVGRDGRPEALLYNANCGPGGESCQHRGTRPVSSSQSTMANEKTSAWWFVGAVFDDFRGHPPVDGKGGGSAHWKSKSVLDTSFKCIQKHRPALLVKAQMDVSIPIELKFGSWLVPGNGIHVQDTHWKAVLSIDRPSSISQSKCALRGAQPHSCVRTCRKTAKITRTSESTATLA